MENPQGDWSNIPKYNWILFIFYTDGKALQLPFVNYQEAVGFAHMDGDHVDRYYIEAIKPGASA